MIERTDWEDIFCGMSKNEALDALDMMLGLEVKEVAESTVLVYDLTTRMLWRLTFIFLCVEVACEGID